ncbi:MAG: MBL fold metallo-hydrolase [Alteromonadaceae bacterium]|nr:MBL fold metallo-hydrolase [Alteromonadaceae bacterium]
MQLIVTSFFDEATFTFSYVVQDPETKSCAIIDSVLNFDYAAGKTSFTAADEILKFIDSNDLKVDWILESHVHADHLSAAPYLKKRTGARIGIGSHVREVQQSFNKVFNNNSELDSEGLQFDKLFDDNELIKLGNIQGRAMHTPGHTPACMTYLFGDAAFVGDTLFMPDSGTARCDFPGGDAAQLFHSIKKIFTLPDSNRLFICHDYKAPGRDEYANETTVAAERESNIHVGGGTTEAEYVKMRTERDSTLSMPRLILPAVQVNIRAGHMPPAEDNGLSYLKIPINLF